MKRIFLSLLAAMVALIAMPAVAQTRIAPADAGQLKLSFAPVVRQVAPAVVNVYASRNVARAPRSPFFDDPFFRRFFGAPGGGIPQERVQRSLGSGVLVSADGLVVTNNHVIEGADEVRIALSDRREFEAKLVLKDPRTDLAVLRIDDPGEELPFLEFNDSDGLEVGDIVLAVGNPFGVGQTVTSGIVSAIARTQVGVSDVGFFIQTDAAINPGNSGGALVDVDGRLVGINTAIYSRSGGSIGIGFAIPSNMVRFVVRSAAGDGRLRRPWLGARLEAVTSEIAESLGFTRPVGVLVADITRDSPAAKAGLRTGDVIVSVDGHEVSDANSFRYRLVTRGIGGTAELALKRGGRDRKATLPLEGAPEVPPRDEVTLKGRNPFQGIVAANLSPAVAEEMGRAGEGEGVVVVSVDQQSSAARVGFKRGDVIRWINGVDIDSTKKLEGVLERPARGWEFEIERDGRILHNAIRG
ncbi:MAG: Do family serine endopeptidase [Flavobacteriaceae bacterium]